jgi:hypothetical protein
MLTTIQPLTEMIILQKQDHGCIYTIDPDTNELYCAPIYKDNTVNLSEFAPVDLTSEDNVDEILNIQKELIALIK